MLLIVDSSIIINNGLLRSFCLILLILEDVKETSFLLSSVSDIEIFNVLDKKLTHLRDLSL